MKLLVRADASPTIGAGHVMRCLALAQAWQDVGGDATCVSQSLSINLSERLSREHINVIIHTDIESGSQDDARLVIELAEGMDADVVVLDGYCFGKHYQDLLRSTVSKLMVIDDYNYSKQWNTDILLNQNLHSDEYPYEGCGRCLLGPRFALLRREFRQFDPLTNRLPSDSLRLLVTFGGADPNNISSIVLRALDLIPGSFDVRIVCGAVSVDKESYLKENSRHRVVVIHNSNDMAELFHWSDLVIGAAGSTCWEWLFFQRPAAVIAVAKNQIPIAASLQARGLANYLGWHEAIAPATLAQKLQAWFDSDLPRFDSVLVDGQGAERVVQTLLARD